MKRGAEIGSFIGFIVFCLFGFMAGVYFGGYGAVSILSKFSGTLEPTLISRVVVVCGMVVGVVCMLSVSVILGALIGAALGVSVKNVAYAASK